MKPLWDHQKRDIEFYKQTPHVLNFSDQGCVSCDTEYLTPTGWRRIDQYDGGVVAQYIPTHDAIEFVTPNEYIKEPCELFYHIAPSHGTSQKLSGEHRVLYFDRDCNDVVCSMNEFYHWHHSVSNYERGKNPRWFRAGFNHIRWSEHSSDYISLSEAQIRVMVMAIADGTFPNKTDNKCVLRLKKPTKIARAKMLLGLAKIPYTEKPRKPEGFVGITFMAPRREKKFGEYWWGCDSQQLQVISEESCYWDASIDRRNGSGVRFSTYEKQSADFIQFAYASAGYATSLSSTQRTRRGRVDVEYTVHRSSAPKKFVGIGRYADSIKLVPSEDGFKYCFDVPSHFLLLRHNGYIFATGNTGKTRTCIEVFKHDKNPILILAPKSILSVAWGQDIDTFGPGLTYSVATAANRADAFNADTQIKITNHDAVKWLIENPKYLQQFKGGRLVIDESTAYKNPSSQRSKAADHLLPYFKHRSCMSGTPTPQGLVDLWHQAYIADQGERLGNSFWAFRQQTYQPSTGHAAGRQFTKWEEIPGMMEACMDLISDITIRNIKSECLDLPPNVQTTYKVELSAKHRKIYEEMKRTARILLESGDISAVNAGVLLGKLLQIASGAVYDEYGQAHTVDKSRAELVMDLVEQGDHTVVAYNWKHQRQVLEEESKKRKMKAAFIDGSVNDADRIKAVRDFQAGKLNWIGLHPASAAHGITLTTGNTTIWVSPTHNAEHFEQLNARIDRGGQTRKTQTIMIAARNTVEVETYTRLMNKVTNLKDLLAMAVQ